MTDARSLRRTWCRTARATSLAATLTALASAAPAESVSPAETPTAEPAPTTAAAPVPAPSPPAPESPADASGATAAPLEATPEPASETTSEPALPPPADAPLETTPEPASETTSEPALAPPADDAHAEPAPPPDTAPAVAPATHPAPPPPPGDARPAPDDGRLGTHQSHFILSAGFRQNFVSNPGFDPFSSHDALPELAVAAGRTLASVDRVSFALLALWDWGEAASNLRGADTSLRVNRLTLGAEGRYHVLRRLYVFGRVAPGALRWSATYDDRVAGTERGASAWVFATDLSAGAAFEFAGEARGASSRPRGWVGADGGYAWAGASQVELESTENRGPVRLQSLAFGDLALRGPFFRVSAALTF